MYLKLIRIKPVFCNESIEFLKHFLLPKKSSLKLTFTLLNFLHLKFKFYFLLFLHNQLFFQVMENSSTGFNNVLDPIFENLSAIVVSDSYLFEFLKLLAYQYSFF